MAADVRLSLWFRWRRATLFLWLWLIFALPLGLLLIVMSWACDLAADRMDRTTRYFVQVADNARVIERARRRRYDAS